MDSSRATIPLDMLELHSRNDMLARENLELKQQLLNLQDKYHRASTQNLQTWCQLHKLTRLMESYLEGNRPVDMDGLDPNAQNTASLLGLPGLQLASLSNLGSYTGALGGDATQRLDLAANLGYSDMADASQRMSFVRDGYAYDRKTSYENDAALLSQRFGSDALMEPAFKRARTSALANELGLGMDMQDTRSLLASQMARMGVPTSMDEAAMAADLHAHTLYPSSDMPGRHNSGPTQPLQASPQVDDGDKYLLSAKVNSIYEIWQEFFHQGPDSKPPVLQLMAKYGVEKWFCRSTTPEGLNNRKNIWNRRNKAVVFEILYQIYHEGKSEDDALASLDALLTNGTLKTPTVAGLALHLRERGVVSCPDKKAAVDHILLSLIGKLNPEAAASKGGVNAEEPVGADLKHDGMLAAAQLASEAPRGVALVA